MRTRFERAVVDERARAVHVEAHRPAPGLRRTDARSHALSRVGDVGLHHARILNAGLRKIGFVRGIFPVNIEPNGRKWLKIRRDLTVVGRHRRINRAFVSGITRDRHAVAANAVRLILGAVADRHVDGDRCALLVEKRQDGLIVAEYGNACHVSALIAETIGGCVGSCAVHGNLEIAGIRHLRGLVEINALQTRANGFILGTRHRDCGRVAVLKSRTAGEEQTAAHGTRVVEIERIGVGNERARITGINRPAFGDFLRPRTVHNGCQRGLAVVDELLTAIKKNSLSCNVFWRFCRRYSLGHQIEYGTRIVVEASICIVEAKALSLIAFGKRRSLDRSIIVDDVVRANVKKQGIVIVNLRVRRCIHRHRCTSSVG